MLDIDLMARVHIFYFRCTSIYTRGISISARGISMSARVISMYLVFSVILRPAYCCCFLSGGPCTSNLRPRSDPPPPNLKKIGFVESLRKKRGGGWKLCASFIEMGGGHDISSDLRAPKIV